MEESKVLEAALKSCQLLEKSLLDSIKEVRRLNLRYNIDWFVNNYNVYVANIWTQYQSLLEKESPTKSQRSKLTLTKTHRTTGFKTQKSSGATLLLNTRSSNELVGSNRRINYKFLKIKRGMEALLLQVQHVIDIANRQKNFMHFNKKNSCLTNSKRPQQPNTSNGNTRKRFSQSCILPTNPSSLECSEMIIESMAAD